MTTNTNNSILLRYPRNTETVTANAKTLNVNQALQKLHTPLSATRVNIDVKGIFSLPETWKNAIQNNDPAEASYAYELEVAGIKMVGARGIQRELTEEEKAAAFAADPKNKAKAPPPKGKVEEKQPTEAELAEIEKHRLAKEEQERVKQAEWDKLSEEEKFHTSAEDIVKNPRIAIENKPAIAKFKAADEELQKLIAAAD